MSNRFQIGLTDSKKFARLSGDFNPLHIDPIAARRTQFGGTAVHGIHLLLKSIDLMLGNAESGQGVEIDAVRCTFSNPVPTGRDVTVQCTDTGGGTHQLRAVCDGRRAFVASVSIRSAGPAGSQPAESAWSEYAPAPSVFPPGRRSGHIDLRVAPALLSELFPALANLTGRFAVADLLATTNLVGMHLPGLHSIYSALKLARSAERPQSEPIRQGLTFAVRSTDQRFSGVELEVEGSSLSGSVSAFYRPAPSEQAAMAQVQAQVRPGEFSGHRVLVVGGSRGLGEVVTKVLVAGGAEVTFTFARGQHEAATLLAEVNRSGLRAKSLQLDVLDPEQAVLREKLAGGAFTHVYYFATPHIGRRPRGTWHQQTFIQLCAYYLDGFARLAELPELQRAVYCYPSTIYLEQPEAGFAEYCAAKAAGENLCRALQLERGLRILAPRLERMRTDQTASVSGASGADPLLSLVPVVRQVQRDGAS